MFSCEKSNHITCARVWFGDFLDINTAKNFRFVQNNRISWEQQKFRRCLECRKETKKSVMDKDLDCIAILEEDETALVEMMKDYEQERAILLRDGKQ